MLVDSVASWGGLAKVTAVAQARMVAMALGKMSAMAQAKTAVTALGMDLQPHFSQLAFGLCFFQLRPCSPVLSGGTR